jgi:hypothetical protein
MTFLRTLHKTRRLERNDKFEFGGQNEFEYTAENYDLGFLLNVDSGAEKAIFLPRSTFNRNLSPSFCRNQRSTENLLLGFEFAGQRFIF